jgi:predicted permease
MLSDVRHDLVQAARVLRKQPGFAVTAIATIALGLGANTAIFSLVDAVLLKPLPYPEPDRLLILSEKLPGGGRNAVSGATFLDWRESSRSISLVGSTGNWLTWTGDGEPRRVQARLVSYDYFDILGAHPATGRGFRPEEGQPGNDHVLLITHRFWFQQLGGAPDVIGRKLTLDGSQYTILGTLPADSWLDRHPAEVWMPLVVTHAASRDFHYLGVYGRLRPGANLAAARAEMDTIGARIAVDHPASNKGWGVVVDLLTERVVNDQLRQALYVLFAAVGAVWLIACVNLANLLLARSAAREREVWVRISLGAGRARLVQQLLTESLLLSAIGGAAGCGLAYGLLRALIAGMPPFTLPTQADVRIDASVLAYLLVMTVLSGILFGLAPATAAWRRNLADGLKEGYRGSTGGSGRHLRSALIVAEVALSFVLVATAGLLIHSFMRLTNVDLGVDLTNVVTMQLPRAMQRDTDSAREARVMGRVRDAVAALPGVREAALTGGMPLQGFGFGMPFEIQGASAAENRKGGGGLKMISPNYFRALGMTMRAGRPLAETDRAGTTPVTVINQTLARQFFKNANPIGQHIAMQRIVTGKHELGPMVPWEIVGVVADERTGSLDGDLRAGMYVSFDQSPIVGVGLVVRARAEPLKLNKAIQSAIWSVNPDQAITDFKLLEQIKTEAGAGSRFLTLILTGFAALALLLAAVGIYGVVAWSVTQRRREMGIRAALGATRTRLLDAAMRRSLLLAASGLILGVLGTVWSGKLVATLLFHTKPAEASTLAAVAGVIGTVALAAALIPAQRAARIDPAKALREE